MTELNVSKIALDSECETQSEEQCNRKIPGNKESCIKSSLAIDDSKPKDLESIEDVDQSFRKQTLLKNGRGIDKNFEILVSTLLNKFNSLKQKVDSLIDKIKESKAVNPSSPSRYNSKTFSISKSLNDKLVIGRCVE